MAHKHNIVDPYFHAVQSLMDAMYPGVSHIVPSERAQDNWYSECTILCAQNDDVGHVDALF